MPAAGLSGMCGGAHGVMLGKRCHSRGTLGKEWHARALTARSSSNVGQDAFQGHLTERIAEMSRLELFESCQGLRHRNVSELHYVCPFSALQFSEEEREPVRLVLSAVSWGCHCLGRMKGCVCCNTPPRIPTVG